MRWTEKLGSLLLFVVIGFLLLTASCHGGDGDDGRSGLRIAFTSLPPAAGVSDVVWLTEGGRVGEFLQVDVVARDISSPFDGFDLEILFDPLVASAQSVTSGGALDLCAAVPILKADNVGNDNANQTGTILISEAISGSTPPACTVSGQQTLTRLAFRSVGRGTSSLEFASFNGDPNAPTGSRFYRSSPAMPSAPVQFIDNGAALDVTR